MKMIPVPKEPGEVQDLLNSGYDRYSINQRYKADLDNIRKEYSMMALLKGNANVVYCDDICDEPNPDGIGWKLYIRMEMLTPLTKVLADPFSEAQVIKVGMDLCNALTACKRKNIIHRDIKPANIMVAEDGNYKLGDFGVAKTMEGTSGGTKTGTYNFMAPEVYNNRPYGQSADLYSLGMVLYWMLNRRCGPFLPLPPTVPTASQMENAKERRFGGEQLPPPVNGSQALKQIVLRACAFDPAQRYTTPEELYADLAEVAKTQPEDHSYRQPGDHSYRQPEDHSYRQPEDYSYRIIQGLSNSWEHEYDKTQGSVYGGGGTLGGSGNGSHIGPFDIRGQVQVTAQELATGCVKRVAINNVLDNIVMEAAMKAHAGSAASAYARAAAKMVDITIPAGTKAGTVLRLTGAGRVDTATGAAGDAYVTVIIDDSGSPNDFWGEKNISGEVIISPSQAKNGVTKMFRLNEKTYMAQLPANLTDMQEITVEAKTPGGNMEKLTIRIRIEEPKKEKKKKKTPWGAIIWIALGFGMFTVAPPLAIGWIALGIPFLFIGRKK
jgi:hypothetical protein